MNIFIILQQAALQTNLDLIYNRANILLFFKYKNIFNLFLKLLI